MWHVEFIISEKLWFGILCLCSLIDICVYFPLGIVVDEESLHQFDQS